MPQEDPENAVAAARFAIIQGPRKPVGRNGRQGKAECRVRGDSQEHTENQENSEDLMVSVTELEEELGMSEETGISTRQVAQQARSENDQNVFFFNFR